MADKLTDTALEALDDFDTTCRNLGCKALDVEKFTELLRHIGYEGDDECSLEEKAHMLFIDLIDMIATVSGKKTPTMLVIRPREAEHVPADQAAPRIVNEESSAAAKKGGGNLNRFWFCGAEQARHDQYLAAVAGSDDMVKPRPVSEREYVPVIDRESLELLYKSVPYNEVDENANTGAALLSFVEELFAKFDVGENGAFDRQRAPLENMLHHMLEGDALVELLGGGFDIDAFMASVDLDNDGFITKKEMLQALLKFEAVECDKEPLPRDFNVAYMDPAITSDDKFCDVLSEWVGSHEALKHHFTTVLKTGGYGKKSKQLILQFLTSYRAFSKNFVQYVKATIELLHEDEHKNILKENAEEELGNYEDDDIMAMEELGLDPRKLVGVPHTLLYEKFLANCAKRFGVSCKDEALTAEIAAPMVKAFEKTVLRKGRASAASAIGALYFCSENIVPGMYRTFLDVIEAVQPDMIKDELAFMYLHVEMDADHAAHMKKVAVHLAHSEVGRKEMVDAVQTVMAARCKLFENVIRLTLQPGEKDAKAVMSSDKLYDAQSKNWRRTKPTCLSDFTGRPVVFNMIEPHVDGAHVLDVGCGEGYVARKMIGMGAASVVGIDVSAEMVANAENNKISPKESYLQGDCTSIKIELIKNPDKTKVMPGADIEVGCFNLAVAVFVFNYVTVSDMRRTMDDVYRLLKPGGTFVFSVPHPFMLLSHGAASKKAQANDTFSFRTAGEDMSKSYFSLRDRAFGGTIKTTEGKGLDVKMMFKTFEDYTKALDDVGFSITKVHEARVLPEHMKENPAFFDSVKDVPLHLVFKARKPENSTTLGSSNVMDLLPKKIRWSSVTMNHPKQSMVMDIPPAAQDELSSVVLRCYDMGLTADTFEMNVHAKMSELTCLAEYAALVRHRLLVDVGAILVRGLKMERYGGMANVEKMTHCSRLAYYIFSSLIGQVDAGARGRLFDVKSASLDVKADNVLFSVSNTEAGWHTDGASRDRVYDVVSLLCIVPASEGGEFKISNAVNALENLKLQLPKFLQFELMRPVPRDVLENGSGKGVGDFVTKLSRSKHLLARRIKHNSYPIYVEKGDRMRFRYMRYWIESAHEKVDWPLSPLLRIAMDMLDKELDKGCCFDECLQSGDLIYSNNMLIAHARNSFVDSPDKPPRHKVRAWLQVQKSHLAAAGFKP